MEPLGRFLEYSMESLESILKAPLGQTLGQKPSGPAAPRVFGLGSGLGGPSIFSLGTPLRTLGNLPRGSIHHYTPSAFPQIVPLYRYHCGFFPTFSRQLPRVNVLAPLGNKSLTDIGKALGDI